MAPLLKRLVGDVDDTLHAARSFRTDAGNRSEPQKPHIADAMRGSS
jgi:hypothetical protein